MEQAELDLEIFHQFLVDVGPAAKELVCLFADETKARLLLMDQLASARDWMTLAVEAHALKGASKTYGLVRLPEIARLLEQACRNNDGESSLRIMGDLPDTTNDALDALVREIQVRPFQD